MWRDAFLGIPTISPEFSLRLGFVCFSERGFGEITQKTDNCQKQNLWKTDDVPGWKRIRH